MMNDRGAPIQDQRDSLLANYFRHMGLSTVNI